MPEPLPAGQEPAHFLADMHARAVQSTLGLMTRRSQAMTDYLQALASVRQPNELVALQVSYFGQMLDDYSAAMAESLEAAPPPEPESQPSREPSQAAA